METILSDGLNEERSQGKLTTFRSGSAMYCARNCGGFPFLASREEPILKSTEKWIKTSTTSPGFPRNVTTILLKKKFRTGRDRPTLSAFF